MRRFAASLSICLLLTFAVSGLSQQNPPAPAAQQTPPQAAEKSFAGTLSKVDMPAREITVKGTDNKEMVFTWNDRTKIDGVDNGPQGLSGKTGASLKITYQDNYGSNLATKIEVAQKKD